MSPRSIGYAALLLWVLTIYFAVAAAVVNTEVLSPAEEALVTLLGILAGACGIAAAALAVAYGARARVFGSGPDAEPAGSGAADLDRASGTDPA